MIRTVLRDSREGNSPWEDSPDSGKLFPSAQVEGCTGISDRTVRFFRLRSPVSSAVKEPLHPHHELLEELPGEELFTGLPGVANIEH